MQKKILYTKSKARIQFIRNDAKQPYHWLFLPGGPGLGSESLKNLTELLSLPGTLWYVDLPGDGSNIINNEENDFSDWQKGLIEAVDEFEYPILVAHSSGGMFALATSALQHKLKGLVLMDSAPDAGWQKYFSDYVEAHPIPEINKLQAMYTKTPSNELLKQLTLACLPYFSMPNNIEKMRALTETLPFNFNSHQWAEKYFDPIYQATWFPLNIPTLIFAGDHDCITPLKLFREKQEFCHKNILIREILNAAHFPWMDNPEKVKQVFEEYCRCIF